MKHRILKAVVASAVLTGLAFGQAPPKKMVGTPVKTAPKTATATPAPAKSAAKAPAKSVTKPAAKPVATSAAAKSAPVKAPVKKVVTAAKPAAAKAARSESAQLTSVTPAGKRDPFVNPIKQDEGAGLVACNSGVRCLVIAQIVLKGVIKTPNGMIAMVENPSKKEYNIHEKDVVMNGSVAKITTDSVIFSETVTDLLGR